MWDAEAIEDFLAQSYIRVALICALAMSGLLVLEHASKPSGAYRYT